MTFKLSARSRDRLRGVHPDLVSIFERGIAITPIDFMIVEGLRTRERQRELVEAGASQTMNSRHLTGHAVDIAPIVAGQLRWDWPLYFRLAPVIKQAAEELGIPVEWGGDWKSFRDAPHWQLPRSVYP